MAQAHDPHTAWLLTMNIDQLEMTVESARSCLDSAMRMGKAFDIARLQSNLGSASQILASRRAPAAHAEVCAYDCGNVCRW
jgi:hypothetical protein